MEYRPSKTQAFWACVVAIIATLFIGFGPGGWVSGGTAAKMVQDAREEARTQLVADACVARYTKRDDFASDLEKLKAASSWKQGDIVADGGWATVPGMKEPLDAAARQCANQLVSMDLPVADTTKTASAPETGS